MKSYMMQCKRLNIIALFLFLFFTPATRAQIPDKIYADNIHNVKLNYLGNQLAYPILRLNSGDQLELNFDDLNGGVGNYSYAWQLRNADWSPTVLSDMDYVRGFTQSRITTYRNSSIALQPYTHYMLTLPERNSVPSRSGNYLLKVFADGYTARLLFTRRVLVVDEKTNITAYIRQPFDGRIFSTHQKIVFTVGLGNLNLFNAMQQVKVCVLQNNRWDNAMMNVKPTFLRPAALEFNSEDIVFPGGREWRWLDLRSFRLQSDRVETADYHAHSTDVYVKADQNRVSTRLVYYKDYNGMFYNETLENLNPLWQTDFAYTHFVFVPGDADAFRDKDVYLFGELTNYGLDEKAKMSFNMQKGVYETTLLLKNGYYSYGYVTLDPQTGIPSFDLTEGNLWDTENNYTILVYYRNFSSRADELVGISHLNSLGGRVSN